MQAPNALNPMPSDVLRLVIAFVISLILHLLLIFEVSVGRVEQGGSSARTPMVTRLQARIVEAAEEPLLKAIDAPVPSKVQDYVPPADTLPTADQAKSNEPAQQGIPKEAASPTTINAPAPFDTTYYGMKDVDVRPRALGNPVYPDKANQLNVSGKVRVRILLNEHGRIDQATLEQEDPPGWGFGDAVLAYLKNGRFKPAMRKGQPVRSVVSYELEFKIETDNPEIKN